MSGISLNPDLPPASAFTATTDLQNAGTWQNLTSWAMNVTRYAPSFEDLMLAGPRMARKLGSLIVSSDSLDASGHESAFDVYGTAHDHATIDPNFYNNVMDTGATGGDGGAAQASRISMDGARGLGSVFSYATSKWALSCIAMAILLNRTHIFAATRRRLRLRWDIRLALRIAPIMLLVWQIRRLLQSMQCQTSPDFSELRWGDATKSSDLMFNHGNAFLNSLSSTLLFGASDERSCVSAGMIPADYSTPIRDLRGSLSRLWPLFSTFCLSHFLETVSCAVQGRPVAAETGMTLFEQSLAFAEADAAISNQLGWDTFKIPAGDGDAAGLGNSIAVTRSMILRKVNTPPEILLVAFLSAMTHLSSHILGVFGLQSRYRLFNTGFWGVCFMTSIVASVVNFDLEDPDSQGLLRFPTVCIIGFLPHVLVLGGIAMCLCIYGLALFLTALAPPPNQELASMTFRERLAHAHENMQANVSLSDIRITREMDFYTALLRAGFAAISMASEAVYLNEDNGVNLKRHTWLEESRFQEAEELQKQWYGMGLPGSKYDQVGTIGLIPVKGGPLVASNGYARERAAQKLPKAKGERGPRLGIGAAERSSRWLMAFEFTLSIARLVSKLFAWAMLWIMGALRIRSRPAWLLWLARRPKVPTEPAAKNERPRKGPTTLPYNDNGRIPRKDGIDVEAEFRRTDTSNDEEVLDTDLYKYWLKGGWWGSVDTSGDFVPNVMDMDWDTTSVVSMSTNADDFGSESEWVSEDDGQRTPTQRSPFGSREGTPAVDSPLNMRDLARLLHPTNTEERQEAQALSAHLSSDRIMTRSAYRRLEQLKRTRILTTSAGASNSVQGSSSRTAMMQVKGRTAKLNPDEEETLLEQLLLSRRQANNKARQGRASAWEDGASGMGGDGPQCVVCQSSPRTIIVWPCRCLSLCDDCRVSLAMNNFDKCVCCRREVISFSRIFVP